MVLPTIHIDISGTAVAFYGAVLATITATVQIANFLRDRMRLKVEVLFNRQIIGDHVCSYGQGFDPRHNLKKLLIQIKVTNVGRRPITLTGIAIIRLFPCMTNIVVMNVTPDVPRELTEGKYVDAFLPQDEINLAEIRSWEASTSTGRTFRHLEAPWHRRLVSDWSWKRHFKEERAKKAAAQMKQE
jgi:hypothetical protein